MDLEIDAVLLVDALELIRADLLDKCVIDVVQVFLVGQDVLGGDEFVVFGLEQSYGVSEVSYLVLVGVVEDVIVLNEVLGDD